ncbi:MAG: hypothetical protein RKK15_09890 [Defluviicoccus sp.]|nr:hypothetical protein [Defluviicoccus sp.]
MRPQPALARNAGELLLALLEQRQPAIAGSVLADLDPDIRLQLRGSGCLQRTSVRQSIQVVDEAGAATVDLQWLDAHQRYGLFDAADGWVIPDPEEITLYRLDTAWWLAWLTAELDLVNAGRPIELVADHAWDLGDFRVSRKRVVPLLFARRLRAPDVRAQLATALARRAGRSGGVMLTSTRRVIETLKLPGAHCLMPVAESLTADAARFRLDAALIQGLYLGQPPDATPMPVLDLSPDGMTLTIHGDVLHFRGAVQRAIVKQLVEAHRSGKRLRTSAVLAKAGSSADSLVKAFSGSPHWPTLSRHLRQEQGCCWFEP